MKCYAKKIANAFFIVAVISFVTLSIGGGTNYIILKREK